MAKTKDVYVPHIGLSQEDKVDYFRKKGYGGLLFEKFEGEVDDKTVDFPKELGVEHPFDYQEAEDIFKNFGFINGAVDKYEDAIISDFSVSSKDRKIQTIIDSFIKDSSLICHLREWVKEGIMKGAGFMELDLKALKVRVNNSKYMYVVRDKSGNTLGYNQWIHSFNRLKKGSTKPKFFKPNQIAQLNINKVAGEAYGLGYVFPNLTTINLLMGAELDYHKLIKRKGGMPIHVKVGTPEMLPSSTAVDSFKSDLQYMDNRTEWVTDGGIDMKVLDFRDIGKNITDLADHDIQLLAMGMQIPMVLMGVANIPEGLAKTQLEAFQRNVASIQLDIEKVVSSQIFKPLLQSQGLSGEVEFKWNLPSETEINRRLERVEKLLTAMTTVDENYRRMLQIEHARLMGFDDTEIELLRKPEKGLDDEKEMKKEEISSERKEEEEEITQPEIPTEKPNANEGNLIINITNQEMDKVEEDTNKTTHIQNTHDKCMHGEGCGQQLSEAEIQEMTIQEWVNLQEFEKFNYSDYLIEVLRQVKRDRFSLLLAKTEQDLIDGLLPKSEIDKLRVILGDGFRENKTIREIENEIRNNVVLSDRMKDGKITLTAKARPNSIARTETVRLANKGLLNHYQQNKVEKIRFLAALSERTCTECESLNGRIFTQEEAEGVIPVHSCCRCTWIPVIE